MKTAVRWLETFVIVFLSALLSQIAVSGQPLDLTQAETQSRLLTAVLAAFGVAVRRSAATPPGE